jgi:hypothetical protein
MKVKTIITEQGIIFCRANCIFLRECANHETANEDRIESGFTPELFEENNTVYCRTIEKQKDETIKYGSFPVDTAPSIGALYLDKEGNFKKHCSLEAL